MAIQVAAALAAEDGLMGYEAAVSEVAAKLDGAYCDLCVLFASGTALAFADEGLAIVHDVLHPAALIGCGAGGVVGDGRELEAGSAVVLWCASLSEGRVETHHLLAENGEEPRTPDAEQWDSLLLLADPYSFAVEPMLERLDAEQPGRPVLGGLASAAIDGSGVLFRDREVLREGAVAASLHDVAMVPCVSQGAMPVGPEMTITAADGNYIEGLASQPALERLKSAIASLSARERELATGGVMLGIVIDENQPDFTRGDFLIRPIVGVNDATGALAVGEQVRVGQTVRLHVRDGAAAAEDLRAALAVQSQALGSEGAAGALLFTCNGRGSHMFPVPHHDAAMLQEALGVAAGGFFCAGEIGPVGGRSFLHGFTATMAVFPKD